MATSTLRKQTIRQENYQLLTFKFTDNQFGRIKNNNFKK